MPAGSIYEETRSKELKYPLACKLPSALNGRHKTEGERVTANIVTFLSKKKGGFIRLFKIRERQPYFQISHEIDQQIKKRIDQKKRLIGTAIITPVTSRNCPSNKS